METEEEKNKIKALERKLAECEGRAAEYLDGWRRAKADYINSKREMDTHSEMAHRRALENLAKELVEMCDEFAAAFAGHVPKSPWADGIRHIYSKAKIKLKNYGVKEIEAEGKAFNPHFHEAVESVPVDDETNNGVVLEVIQKGYKMGGTVIRPAKVKVGDKK